VLVPVTWTMPPLLKGVVEIGLGQLAGGLDTVAVSRIADKTAALAGNDCCQLRRADRRRAAMIGRVPSLARR